MLVRLGRQVDARDPAEAGLEEYSRTDEGALYAIRGSPLRRDPLNLIPPACGPSFVTATA